MLLKHLDGVDSGAAGGKHWVDNVDVHVFDAFWKLAIVFVRFVCDLIAV